MNPFTRRGRITDPHHFIGRWRELSVIFDRLQEGRPVLVCGVSGIGKSSLLTHIAQSAAVNLERPEMAAYYIDLAVLPDAAACYELMVRALGSRGNTAAALEVAVLKLKHPVVFCLDNVGHALANEWGASLLEQLARVVRHSVAMRPAHLPLPTVKPSPDSIASETPAAAREYLFLLVAAINGSAPALSEPFSVVGIGAFSPPEVRLLSDAYLQGTGVSFSPAELRELSTVSMDHPAYLQRAAFHLFHTRSHPDYDWRAAYLEEARERPVPGTPLPPAIFEGGEVESLHSVYGYLTGGSEAARPEPLEIGDMGDLLALLLPLVITLIVWQLSGDWLVTGIALVGAILIALLIRWWRASRANPSHENGG